MVTTVLVRCPACDAGAELRPDELSLNVCALLPSLSFYAWACPGCARFVYRHADLRTIQMLVSGGVTARAHRPASPRADGRPEPLTEDDLIEFGREIEALPSGTEPQRQVSS